LALAVLIRWLNGTISFSDEIIPTMSLSSVNSSLAMPSKHFLRCGWTRIGSFVSDRISSSSSLDRKKNLPTHQANVINLISTVAMLRIFAFGALTLLVRRQEGHPAVKN